LPESKLNRHHEDENSDPNTEEASSLFALMGEYGNNVNVYDSNSFVVRHQIYVQNLVKMFKFANSNRDLICATSDCRIRFYSLSKYEGVFLREISTVHRGDITSMSVSNNSGYLMTGG
jgi:hypothetical protein